MAYNLTGNAWSEPIRITYSLVPDGTTIGNGVTSNLQSTLNGNPATAANWRTLVQKAAAAWQYYANVQLVQVGDDGSTIGVAGFQQGDSRFGDIRIGGYTQSMGQLGFAFAAPPDNGGTLAGDVFFNTAQPWTTNGGTYDFYTVMVHEFGHALGLGHATTSNSFMYPVYTTAKTVFQADDRNGIDAIYGAQDKDPYDNASLGNTSSTAVNINSLIDASARISLPGLSTHTYTDSDWFVVTVPSNTNGTMTIRAQATDLSSMIPQIQLWNSAASTRLAIDNTQTDYSSTASITYTGVSPGQVYRIKVSPNVTTFGAVGAYGLQLNFGSSSQPPIAPPDTSVPSQFNQNSNWLADLIGPKSLLGRIQRAFDDHETIDLGNGVKGEGIAEVLRPDDGSPSPEVIKAELSSSIWSLYLPNDEETTSIITTIKRNATSRSRLSG